MTDEPKRKGRAIQLEDVPLILSKWRRLAHQTGIRSDSELWNAANVAWNAYLDAGGEVAKRWAERVKE